jgi:hypothetical protein
VPLADQKILAALAVKKSVFACRHPPLAVSCRKLFGGKLMPAILTGQPNEKDILLSNLEFARERTMQMLEDIRKEFGLGPDILAWRPNDKAHNIGWLIGHIGGSEWSMANRMNALVKKPSIGRDDFWENYVFGTHPSANYPDIQQFLDGMAQVRVHIKDVLRSSSFALMDTPIMTTPVFGTWTMRFAFQMMPMHENFHMGEVRYIHKYLLPKK